MMRHTMITVTPTGPQLETGTRNPYDNGDYKHAEFYAAVRYASPNHVEALIAHLAAELDRMRKIEAALAPPPALEPALPEPIGAGEPAPHTDFPF